MPIGSSKLGVLGAGLVPGGTETFNAPGTFSIPPGVKKVSITGVGGTGNPGNPGNAGNAGSPGSGGGGGGGSTNVSGGVAFTSGPINVFNNQLNIPSPLINPSNAWNELPAPSPFNPRVRKGGSGNSSNQGTAGQSGNSGSSGSAGNAGQAGNPGQASSGLGNNFAGGSGGNAGNAGSAGTGGSGGQGGGGGAKGNAPSNTPIPGAAGGNGGGAGGANAANLPSAGVFAGGTGGGGAGATNDGQPGSTRAPVGIFNDSFACAFNNYPANVSQGGNDANACAMATLNPVPVFPWPYRFPSNGGVNLAGGLGGSSCPQGFINVYATHVRMYGGGYTPIAGPGPNVSCRVPQLGARFNNTPDNSNLWRAGGGGAGSPQEPSASNAITGASGGGGRGNAGNAGGSGGAGGTGGAGAPQTFNCVPVTPGCTAPITVGSPGGQIVISWNPQ
jgi:hypothetical protein